jgi:PAS domain S-box-containing protein
MIWYKDPENRMLLVNQAAAASIGLRPDEVEGRKTEEFYPEDAEKYHQDDLAVMQAGTPKLGIIEPYPLPGGKKTWVKTDKIPFRDKEGKIVGVIVVAENVTLQKEQERTMQETISRYERVVRGSNQAVWEWDMVADSIFWSDRLFEILGLDRAELEPLQYSKVMTLMHPDDYGVMNASIEKTMNTVGESRFEYEFRMRHVSGEYRYLYSRGEIIRNAAGIPTFMAGLISDITERKQLEVQLAEAKEAAESASYRKTRFLANMSHEFRTPLNAVIGFSEMLERGIGGSLSDQQKRYVQNISVSGYHLLELVNDILDIAKIEAGKTILTMEEIPVHAVIEVLQGILEEKLHEKSVELTFEVDVALGTIWADRPRLNQILLNLIGNAIKFNRVGGKVTVQFTLDKENLVCQVLDTGIGIPDDKISHLFSEFYQVDDSLSRSHEGTGLGLALTKKLVELHGGHIQAFSRLSEGSRFVFTLPQHRGA